MTKNSKTLILVNGVPASGKSSIAKKIADHFGFPYLALDSIKEPFMEIPDDYNRIVNRELGIAAYKVMWDIVTQSSPQSIFVLDAWFGFQPKDVLARYIEHSGTTHVIEVWNRISGEQAAQRYQKRIPFRSDKHPKEEYIPELKKLADQAKPMAFGEVIHIDQDNPIQMDQVYPLIEASLKGELLAI